MVKKKEDVKCLENKIIFILNIQTQNCFVSIEKLIDAQRNPEGRSDVITQTVTVFV